MFANFDKKEFLLSIGRVVLTASVGGYIFVCLFLYIKQDEMIFLQPKITEKDVREIREFYKATTEEVSIKTPDGESLNGWLNKEKSTAPTPLIIYFGGNGEELSTAIPDKRLYYGYSLAVINYRGFGHSTGTPTEENLYNDALLIYDTLAARPDIDNSNIVVIGRSIGSAVATHLASKRKVTGVILVTPLDSAISVAQGMYPILPMKYILKYKFDSLSLAPEMNMPLLTVVAENDNIISPKHSKNIHNAWGGNSNKIRKELITIKGRDHNTVVFSKDYWFKIGDFLKSLL